MTTAWWTGSCPGFDCETDSPDPADARIISACTTLLVPGAPPQVTNWLLQPEREIPAGAIEVHGITNERAQAEGIERRMGVAEIADMLSLAGEGIPVVGHNLSYDLTLLDRELRRLGLGSLGIERDRFAALQQVVVRLDGRETACFPVLDTLILDKQLDRYRPGKGGRKLTAMAPVYGIELAAEDAHAADADVRTSIRVAIAMARRCSMNFGEITALYRGRTRTDGIAASFMRLRDVSLADMHIKQIEWAAEQADGLAQWARDNPSKTDIDPDSVDGSWPLRAWKDNA